MSPTKPSRERRGAITSPRRAGTVRKDGSAPTTRRLTMAQRRARTGIFALVVALVVGGAIVAAHRHDDGTTGTGARSTVTASTVRYSVGIVDCTFTDTTRDTPDFANATVTKDRVLVTEIRYPTLSPLPGQTETKDAHPARGHGPFPVVVFAHGYDLTPDSYAALLDRWVQAGLVVAAPLFPDTNAAAVAALGNISAPEADDVNQPADLAFVTRELIAAASPTSFLCPVVHGLIDTSKFALAGQSDGATTVAALAFDSRFDRSTPAYRAVIDLSGEQFGAGTLHPDPYSATAGSPPLLVTQSATDTCNPPQYSTALYDAIDESDKWFLEIDSAHHLPPYIGTAGPSFAVVVAVTTRFLADEFAGEAPGQALLSVGTRPGVATLTSGAKAPPLVPLVQSAASCYLTS